MRTVTLAAIQPPNHRDGDTLADRKADNIHIAFALMEQAADRDADLILLPETFPATGLVAGRETAHALAEAEDGPLAQRLVAFARERRVNVVAPVLGRYGDTLRNVAWVISREEGLVDRFFKVHLTDPEAREWGVVAGDNWPVVDLDIGRVGVMTCHDMSFPESARSLALNGAEIICWPHLWSGWGDTVNEITIRSRAIDNAVYLVSACYGVPEGTAWRPGMLIGRSGVIGPDGTVLTDAGRLPGVAMCTVDLDAPVIRHDFTLVGDHDFRATMRRTRRPETYDALVQRATTTSDRRA